MSCILHSRLWDVIAQELTEMVNTHQNAKDFTKIDFAQLRNSNLCSNSNYSSLCTSKWALWSSSGCSLVCFRELEFIRWLQAFSAIACAIDLNFEIYMKATLFDASEN